MKVFALTVTSAAILAAASAWAAVEDTNGDGLYSFEEVLATYPALSESAFLDMDADGDGMLTAEEVAAAEAAGLLPAEG